MKILHHLVLALVFTCICDHVIAQNFKPIVTPDKAMDFKNEIRIGDHMPEVIFKQVMNYKTSQAKISDFKSPLIILDVWSSSCTSCVANFPYMQDLKNKFKNDLQILLINGKTKLNGDSKEKILKLLKALKNRIGDSIQLPIVLNCEVLDGYFPWQLLPHEVWIYKGKVIAITSAEEVNENNIQAILSRGGNKVAFEKGLRN